MTLKLHVKYFLFSAVVFIICLTMIISGSIMIIRSENEKLYTPESYVIYFPTTRISSLNYNFFLQENTGASEIVSLLKLHNIDENYVFDIISRGKLQQKMYRDLLTQSNKIYAQLPWEITLKNLSDHRFSMPIQNGTFLENEYYFPGALRLYRHGIHRGIDLAYRKSGERAPRGEIITSIADGVIVRTVQYEYFSKKKEYREYILFCALEKYTQDKYLDLFRGSQVYVKTGNILLTYSHLDSIDPFIIVGQKIKKGEKIGTMGNSGVEYHGSLAHLHLEIYYNDFIIGINRLRLPYLYSLEIYKYLFGL